MDCAACYTQVFDKFHCYTGESGDTPVVSNRFQQVS
jgi:hypothetical protein